MNKNKAKLVTGLFFVLLVVLAADVIKLVPAALPWILAVFAVPGAWKFCRIFYIWLTTDDDRGIRIQLPTIKKPKGRSYAWFRAQEERGARGVSRAGSGE